MAKARSTETGGKRYYHWSPDDHPCLCTADRILSNCPFALLSVTTVLDILDKPWLGRWAAKMVATIAVDEMSSVMAMAGQEGHDAAVNYLKAKPFQRRDEAAALGTLVHKAAEEQADIEGVPANARGKLLAYHMWQDDYQPEAILQECTLYFPLKGYAGTADLYARINNETWLIDLKTGANMDWKFRLQQAAYRHAAFTTDAQGHWAPPPDVDRVGILHLHDDGYTFYEIKADLAEFDAFCRLVWIARDIEKFKKDKDTVVGTRRTEQEDAA